MILFLDFDGVLHPDDVYLTRVGPRLRSEGQLFMWAGILDDILHDFPDVKLVLSTSWVRHLGYAKARKRLPASLASKVVGSTWHSSMVKDMGSVVWWDQASRYEQIARYCTRAGIIDWIALDDDAHQWNADSSWRLVLTDSVLGLSDISLQMLLRERLRLALIGRRGG